jgi:(p)ppGpp synthase/HD superfamily hydrolase
MQQRLSNFLLASVFFIAPAVVVGPILNRKITQEKKEMSKELLKASSFAAWKHRNQKRKNIDSDTYIIHPLRVSELVATLGGAGDNVHLLQAALLHDTVEDTDTTFDEVENLFGSKVRKLVEEVSDDKSLPKEVRKRLQIEHAAKKSREAKILSMADKVANLEDMMIKPNGIPVGWSVERVQQYCAWALAVSQGLKGESVDLDKRLRELVTGEFQYFDGKKYPALPQKENAN